MSVTVLVVDDDEPIREAVAYALRDEGYTVEAVTDGRAALERLREHADGLVVLLDLFMPEMDGFAVLQAIELEPPLIERHAYVIMTAQNCFLPVGFVEQVTRLHSAILPKPFDLDKLLGAVAAGAERLAARPEQGER